MVALGRTPMVELAGTLRADGDGLRFDPRDEALTPTLLPFRAIAKVTRLRGSPVLMVSHVAGGGARTQTAFYFTQPPALTNIVASRTPRAEEVEDLRGFRSPLGMGRHRSKRRSVRANATYLTREGVERKRELQEWVVEIRGKLTRG
jgi:hypothetical protein